MEEQETNSPGDDKSLSKPSRVSLYKDYSAVDEEVKKDSTIENSSGNKAGVEKSLSCHNEEPSPEIYGLDDEDEDSDDEKKGSNEGNPVELFVGQIPSSYQEEDLKKIFAKFGPIEHLKVLYDKTTGAHKGCAFLTYFDKEAADKCRETMHGKFVLDGSYNPIQVKISGIEAHKKLYVGSIPRSLNEYELTNVFEPFGEVLDLIILRDPEGNSKGCAFVKFKKMQDAKNAMENLNEKFKFPHSNHPIIVKPAESEKQKAQRRSTNQNTMVQNYFQGSPYSYFPSDSSASAAIYSYDYQSQYYSYDPNSHQNYAQIGNVKSVSPTGVKQQLLPVSNSASAAGYRPQLGTVSPGNFGYSIPSNPVASAERLPISGTVPHVIVGNMGNAKTNIDYYQRQNAIYMQQNPHLFANLNPNAAAKNAMARKIYDDNCQLFIYFLPPHINDSDLSQLFSPFGKVVSAKVVYNPETKESKGYGFVTFDNPSSAALAIQQMNGYQIGNKKLKVVIRTRKSSPYTI